MKAAELKELGAEELATKIREARAELADLRLKLKSKAEVQKTSELRRLRRDIARMLTVQNAATKETK